MYRKRDREQVSIDEFITPFGGKLSADNRWVKLSQVIPWDKIEDRYAAKFGTCGNVAIPLRVALGALINISENNYMQYFIDYKEFTPPQALRSIPDGGIPQTDRYGRDTAYHR